MPSKRPLSKGMVTPFNDLILFFTTNSTNKPISLGSGICFPGIVLACSSIDILSFFKRFTNLLVLMGPGASRQEAAHGVHGGQDSGLLVVGGDQETQIHRSPAPAREE